MPSRQDQLHSYQFSVQRVVAALVLREADPGYSPFRRAAGAALASVLVAGIALCGVALYGALVGGGSTRWRDPSAVIVEKESGARYVFRDDRLHLVLNYASALLIIGSDQPRTVLVSRKSIDGVPRGTPLGVAGAPDSLPEAGRLSSGPWTICSTVRSDADGPAPRSVLQIGVEAAGGRPLGDDAVLARHPDGSLHLIWHDHRHLVRDPDLVLSALTWTSRRPVPMAPALLNALPAGADLAPVPIADAGRRSRVRDATIGEVFVVASQGGGRQYAVAERDGLAGITELQANLLLTAARQADPTPLAQGAFATAPQRPDLVPTGAAAPPSTTPKLVEPADASVCGRIRDDSGVPEVRVEAAVPDGTDGAWTGSRSAEGGALADRVVVPPGRGAVVAAAAAPGTPGGALSVVTDLGRRYAVPGTDVLSMLGYGAVHPLRLPAGVVALVPAGAVLDPAAARAPATGQ